MKQPHVLTADLVLQRTKAKSLNEVRSLNMWGQDITDVEGKTITESQVFFHAQTLAWLSSN